MQLVIDPFSHKLMYNEYSVIMPFIKKNISARKARLLSAAVVRTAWQNVADLFVETHRLLLEECDHVEYYADNNDAKPRHSNLRTLERLYDQYVRPIENSVPNCRVLAVGLNMAHLLLSTYARDGLERLLWYCRETVTDRKIKSVGTYEARYLLTTPNLFNIIRDGFYQEAEKKYIMLSVPELAALLNWRGGTVSKLAQAIYETASFENLPILADALEEAGCTDQAILEHCRNSRIHFRGCWVVDLLLGKR